MSTYENAQAISERIQVPIYDAGIVAAARLAGCTTVWSEDTHDGRVIDGVTIRNLF